LHNFVFLREESFLALNFLAAPILKLRPVGESVAIYINIVRGAFWSICKLPEILKQNIPPTSNHGYFLPDFLQ
jgi:hypothetical protein